MLPSRFLKPHTTLCPTNAARSGILSCQLLSAITKAFSDVIFHRFSPELSCMEGDGEEFFPWNMKQRLAGRS